MEAELTTNNFQSEVLEANVPVLVDFWAEWCMPCKMIAPILEELDQEYGDKLKIGRLNVDEHGEIAAQYNVVSIPTLLLFKNGEVVNQHVGAGPRPTIEGIFKEYV